MLKNVCRCATGASNGTTTVVLWYGFVNVGRAPVAPRYGSAALRWPQYAVKVQRSLAPLSRFRGSHIPSADEQQCCRFQSYANSVRSPMKFTSEIDIA